MDAKNSAVLEDSCVLCSLEGIMGAKGVSCCQQDNSNS